MFDKHKGSKQVGPETPETPVSKPAPSAAPASPSGAGKQTMIGSGISIAGDVTADSDLKVEGVIEGRSIESSHDVEIGESGRVTASITAKVVRIAGEVTGDVVGSEKVLISKSGRVHGNVAAPRVQLEDGALFRGSIDMNPTQASAEPKPVAAAKPSPAEVKTSAAKAAGPEAEARKEASLTLKSG